MFVHCSSHNLNDTTFPDSCRNRIRWMHLSTLTCIYRDAHQPLDYMKRCYSKIRISIQAKLFARNANVRNCVICVLNTCWVFNKEEYCQKYV